MPRKGPPPKRPIEIDPVYGIAAGHPADQQGPGRRQEAGRRAHRATARSRAAATKTGTDPVVTLKRALDNVKPTLEVKSRRVGGATYQVPVEVKRRAAPPRWRCAGWSRTRRRGARRRWPSG
ncbi:MAG: 30S ribosomal protein S7 [Nocardioidaceae bacterium]